MLTWAQGVFTIFKQIWASQGVIEESFKSWSMISLSPGRSLVCCVISMCTSAARLKLIPEIAGPIGDGHPKVVWPMRGVK